MCSQFFFIGFALTLFGAGLATVMQSWWGLARGPVRAWATLRDEAARTEAPRRLGASSRRLSVAC